MIKVLFFAKLREEVGVSHIELPFTVSLTTINDVVKYLGEQNGECMANALAADNIIMACNHEVVNRTHCVKDGDELAFYPPVSGG